MSSTALSPFLSTYLTLWSAFCVTAIVIMVADRKVLLPEWRAYARFMCLPWKLALFAPALAFVTFAGRYTNDETWDCVTGSGMAILTFSTAPWSVGLLYQTLAGRRPWRYLIVAMALLLFSSSWFYDSYLLWRDGNYTPRWTGNLLLSPWIYLAAGLLWNLEVIDSPGFTDGPGVRLSFVRRDWPRVPTDTRFGPLILASIPLIMVAGFVLIAFVGWNFGFLRR